MPYRDGLGRVIPFARITTRGARPYGPRLIRRRPLAAERFVKTRLQTLRGLGQADIDQVLQDAIARAGKANTKTELDRIDDEVWEASGKNVNVLKASGFFQPYKDAMNARAQVVMQDPAYDNRWIAELAKKQGEWLNRIQAAEDAKNRDAMAAIHAEILRYESHTFPWMTTREGQMKSDSMFNSLYNRLAYYMGFEEYREKVKELAAQEKGPGFMGWLADLLGIDLDQLKYATILVVGGLAVLVGLPYVRGLMPAKRETKA